MNVILLVVIFISGYVYVTQSVYPRCVFKRSKGWDAYFYVAVWGVIFTITSWVLCLIISYYGLFKELSELLMGNDFTELIISSSSSAQFQLITLKFITIGVISIALASVCGWIMKIYVKNNKFRYCTTLVKAVKGDAFESFLVSAALIGTPILVTLNSSRKFYAGIIDLPVIEDGKAECVELYPLISGYRDKDNLTIVVTADYKEYYTSDALTNENDIIYISDEESHDSYYMEDFYILIPRKELASISFFDPDVHRHPDSKILLS